MDGAEKQVRLSLGRQTMVAMTRELTTEVLGTVRFSVYFEQGVHRTPERLDPSYGQIEGLGLEQQRDPPSSAAKMTLSAADRKGGEAEETMTAKRRSLVWDKRV